MRAQYLGLIAVVANAPVSIPWLKSRGAEGEMTGQSLIVYPLSFFSIFYLAAPKRQTGWYRSPCKEQSEQRKIDNRSGQADHVELNQVSSRGYL